MDALTLAQAAGGDTFTTVWIPLLSVAAGIGGLFLIAARFRPEGESRLYGDAMKMVTELKAQLAEEKAKREHFELRLVEAQADRHDLELRLIRQAERITVLEARLGGRREDDDSRPG